MIDVSFDCHRDAKGKDPDSHSPTLRRYHQLLWSKPLPNGRLFALDISGPPPYLVHRSELGGFDLTSDSISHTYGTRKAISPFLPFLPEDLRGYVQGRGWLISECIVFPGKRVQGQNTINGARGMNRRIGDRFDLTLECIRRLYLGQTSPLETVLDRYQDFFGLFEDFRGYVEFFLLQDLVAEDCSSVHFFLPFTGFEGSPIPADLDSYISYVRNVRLFGQARGSRMLDWCRDSL